MITPSYTVVPSNEELQRQVAGLKLKYAEYRKFKTKYQDMVRSFALMNKVVGAAERDLTRAKRALEIVKKESEDPSIIYYVGRILDGLK